jgi:1-acyl-sn-glycerol-3-phosphate acyltransferase
MAEAAQQIVNLGRVAYRAPLGLGWTLAVHYSGVRVPQIFWGQEDHSATIGFWGKGLTKIMGMRLHPQNAQPDEMGDVIVANHMGFLDVPLLLAYFPAVFIIKMEIRRAPFFGSALAQGGHVFVDRKDRSSRRQAARELGEALAQGRRVIVFPEGRASPEAKRLPFKRGAFAEAQRQGKTVQACVIDYLPDRQALKWNIHRPMIPQLLALLGRKRTDVSIEFFPPEKVEGDPREYADLLQEKIQARLEEHDRLRQGAREQAPEPARMDAEGAPKCEQSMG